MGNFSVAHTLISSSKSVTIGASPSELVALLVADWAGVVAVTLDSAVESVQFDLVAEFAHIDEEELLIVEPVQFASGVEAREWGAVEK